MGVASLLPLVAGLHEQLERFDRVRIGEHILHRIVELAVKLTEFDERASPPRRLTAPRRIDEAAPNRLSLLLLSSCPSDVARQVPRREG